MTDARVEHVTSTCSPTHASALVYAPCCYPHHLSKLAMPKTYKCMCSRCYNGSKSVTKRTIEVHLQRDRDSLQSLSPPNPDLAIFLQLRINQTMELLSGILGGHGEPDLVSDFDGSRQVGTEGALLCCFNVCLSNRYLIAIC